MNSETELPRKLRMKSRECTRWRTAKEKPKEEEVSFRSGGWSEESRKYQPRKWSEDCWA